MNRRYMIMGVGSVLAAGMSLKGGAGFAAEPRVFTHKGLAIRGADPVAYFTEGAPVIGKAQNALKYLGSRWQFADAKNAQSFKDNPEEYAPQFGGYCAFAASRGYLAPTTPEAWTVYKGQLFLNANLRARDLWREEIDENIAKGRANWPAILG